MRITVILALLAVPILFYGLGSYGLVNTDEAIYHVVARHMVRTGNWLHLDFVGEHRIYDTFINAPLHYWAKAALIGLFGDGAFSMRILSAGFGLLTVLAVARYATDLAVGVIGVPASPDVELLLRFLADFGDHGIPVDRCKEAVDVDLAPTLGEGDVLLGRKVLIAKEHDAMVVEGLAIASNSPSLTLLTSMP